MTTPHISLLHDLDLGQGTKVRVDFSQSDTLSISPRGDIDLLPDYFILSQGNRTEEQVEAALHARLLDFLVPYLHVCPNFQALIQRQDSEGLPTPMRAAIDRYKARKLH